MFAEALSCSPPPLCVFRGPRGSRREQHLLSFRAVGIVLEVPYNRFRLNISGFFSRVNTARNRPLQLSHNLGAVTRSKVVQQINRSSSDPLANQRNINVHSFNIATSIYVRLDETLHLILANFYLSIGSC